MFLSDTNINIIKSLTNSQGTNTNSRSSSTTPQLNSFIIVVEAARLPVLSTEKPNFIPFFSFLYCQNPFSLSARIALYDGRCLRNSSTCSKVEVRCRLLLLIPSKYSAIRRLSLSCPPPLPSLSPHRKQHLTFLQPDRSFTICGMKIHSSYLASVEGPYGETRDGDDGGSVFLLLLRNGGAEGVVLGHSPPVSDWRCEEGARWRRRTGEPSRD